uniref:Uncharacterized protein n=1 Tax=Anguilla anguilla TaxID=7936 RepID=A0A0E9QGP2_ANGAN
MAAMPTPEIKIECPQTAVTPFAMKSFRPLGVHPIHIHLTIQMHTFHHPYMS